MGSGLEDDPAPALQFGGKPFAGNLAQGLLGGGQTSGGPSDTRRLARAGRFRVGLFLRFLELGDERIGLVSGELPARLTLGEPHGPTSIAKVGVARFLEKGLEFLDLPCRCRRSRLLTECHATQSLGWALPQPG